MFKFFTTKKWLLWAYLGSFIILTSIWLKVHIDVKINEWFGEFYDMIQKALGTPNAITMDASNIDVDAAKLDLSGTTLVSIKDGKIAREQDFFDMMSMLNQLQQNSGDVTIDAQNQGVL